MLRPLKFAVVAFLFALAAPLFDGAAVDTTKRNEALEPKPTKQTRIEAKQVEFGESRPAADAKVEFVTVPAAKAKTRLPAAREKQKAPVEMKVRTFQTRQTGPARISTANQAPSKFDRKFATPAVARMQGGMSEAGRVKTGTIKVRSKSTGVERINRFVFRRNEPAPAATPAGGENPPAVGAPPPSSSTGS